MKLRSDKIYNSPKKKIKTENKERKMNRFTQMLQILKGTDLTLKLLTLQELSEFTSMATEDSFSSGTYFSTDSFIKALLGLFKEFPAPEELELYPEVLILACRCLSNLIEALPPVTLTIVHENGVSVLVEKLMNIEYIDLAESILSILDKLSGEFPLAILKGNGLLASLQYIDFFNIHNQRMAISIAANGVRGLQSLDRSRGRSTKEVVVEIMPILERLLSYSDLKVLESTTRAISRIVEWASKFSSEEFQEIISKSLIQTVRNVSAPQGSCTNSPMILTILIKVLAFTAKASDSYAGLLVSDFDIFPHIIQSLSGKDLKDNARMSLIANQPPEQILVILSLASDLLPELPNEGVWSLKLPLKEEYKTSEKSLRRLKAFTNSFFERYFSEIIPLLIHAFGLTVHSGIRRKCLECVAKAIWFTDKDIIDRSDVSLLGKFVSDLIGLSQAFISASQSDKEIMEIKAFAAGGLSITYVLLKKNNNLFRKIFKREGVSSQIRKLLESLMSHEADSEVSRTLNEENRAERSVEDVIMNFVQDIDNFEEQLNTQDGDELDHGNENESIRHSDSPMARMMDNMRNAFESIRRESTNTSSSSKHKSIRSISGDNFTAREVTEWMKIASTNIISLFDSHTGKSDDVTSSLLKINDVLLGNITFSDELKSFAALLVGNDTTTGLTGFELLENGILDSLWSFLTHESNSDLQDQIKYRDPLKTRIRHFYSVFCNAPVSNGESGFVEGALICLINRLQECLSRSESFILAAAIPQDNVNSSVIALLGNLSGVGALKSELNSPLLQLAKQIRIKLESEDSEKGHPVIVVRIHAVATFKALEEYLKSRILDDDLSIMENDEEGVLDDYAGVEDDEDEGDVDPLHEDGILNVSDLLLKAEEDSSKSHNPIGETATPQKNIANESLVEFCLDSSSKDTQRKASHNKSKRKNSKKGSKKEKLPSKLPMNSFSFSIGNHQISHSSLIFEALYRYEQEKANNSNIAPNIWNQTYTITFKKSTTDECRLSDTATTSSSENNLIDLHFPFKTFGNTRFDLDQDTFRIMRLLGILHELTSKPLQILGWTDEEFNDYNLLSLPTSSIFINSKITAKMNRQLDEPLIVASHVLPSWCSAICYEYPFLLPFETRLTHLQSQSFGYSRNIVRWQQMSNSTGSQSGMTSILGRIQRQKIRISRKKIFESMIKAMDTYGPAQALLEVEYFDEVGTGLGPTLEFYSQVCQEIRKASGISLSQHTTPLRIWRNDTTYSTIKDDPYLNSLFPYPYFGLHKRKEILGIFQSMGTLVAKALLDSRVLDIPFNPVFVQMCVFGHSSLSELSALKALDPVLFKSIELLQQFRTERDDILRLSGSAPGMDQDIKNITINGLKIDDLCLDFTLPGYPDIELIENGKNLMLSILNVEEYVQKILDITVGMGVKCQINAFRRGFNRVFPIKDLHCFSTRELVVLMGGLQKEDWSLKVLQESIQADHGYNKDSESILNFCLMLSEFNDEERRLFLQFVTGCPRLPFGGFKGLNPPLTVVRKTADSKMEPDDYLPSVMTCVNYVKLPEYSSITVMKEKFQLAMSEGSGSFHLS